MSEEQVKEPTIEDAVVEEVKTETQPPAEPEMQINLDMQTAMAIRLQEFDKKIAAAELEVAKLKSEKFSYVYDTNVQQIVASHREQAIKSQIEEETKKKLAEKAK